MRVIATKEGFYDNVLRPQGEVFDLLNDANGEMPIRMKPPKMIRDKEGNWTGDMEPDEPWLDAEGNAVHADYAPDNEELRGRGKYAGERFRPGWMVEVHPETKLGIYPDVGAVLAQYGAGGNAKPMGAELAPVGRVPIAEGARLTDKGMAPNQSPSRGPIRDRQRVG